MSRLAAVVAGAVLAGGLAATGAQAGGHCSNYAGPTDPEKSQDTTFAYIVTGYRGAGGVGALDSQGCFKGDQLVDTRLVLPRADFAIAIVSAKCKQGTRYPGNVAMEGLGLKAPKVPVVCAAPDGKGRTHYISDPYAISPDATGKITATVTLVQKKKTVFSYVAESHTVV